MTKRFIIWRVLGIVVCLLLPLSAVAGSNSEFDWLKNYSDYERNRFALEMPLTEDNFKALKDHLNRYQYLLLYLPANALGQSSTPNLRIGFYASYQEARDFHGATQYLFRQQHIVRVSDAEHRQVIDELKSDADQPAATDAERLLVFPIESATSQRFKHTEQVILERAKNLYLNKNYKSAARHYQLLATLADDNTAAWAKELAGLCLEKLGRRDEAIAQYRELLQRYPTSTGAARVNQRLRGLETAAADDPSSLKTGSYNNDRGVVTRGVFGQYYRSVERSVNGGDYEKVLSLLSTDWDVRSSLRWNEHDLNARISGYWLDDQLEGGNSQVVFKRLLLDYRHQSSGIGAVLGRQKDSDTGVFTSFDGLTISYPIQQNLRIGISTGEPVYTSDAYDPLDYYFYSVHANWDINDQWLLGSYLVSQTVNSVTDREALGLRGRFSGEHLSASLNIDYDTAFSELNNLLLNLHYRFNDSNEITALYGNQRSPFLSATNILIGQANLDLDAYLKIKENKDSLLDDAFARTALNDYYSLSFSTRLEENVRWIVDFYDSTLSDVPSSEFLLGLPPTGTEPDTYHYQSLGTQLIFQNFFWNNDSVTMGYRHSTGDTSDNDQLYFYERLRLGDAWTVMPRLMYSQLNISSNDSTQQQLRYSLNLIYRPWRNAEFNLELGNETISVDQADTEFNSRYLFMGYRLNF